MPKNKKIGFIGQGWIGKHYADDFEKRGYDVVRYALEEPYVANKGKIKDCDIIFIAVPTPTTPKGFDDSIVREAVKLVGEKKTAVIKSTIVPGTTESIQAENGSVFVLHSPEFLVEKTAAHDAAHPSRNIIGIPVASDEFREKAAEVMAVLPRAPYETVCRAKDAELVKYGNNAFLYFKVIFSNILHDLALKLDVDWEVVRDSIAADPRIGASHMEPIHQSGRGAGGHCFIKDFAALGNLYARKAGDRTGLNVLESLEMKNIELLIGSGKDLDLLRGVYGDNIAGQPDHDHGHGHEHDACGCGHSH
jgi:nucleotide sugar dehydrogenase